MTDPITGTFGANLNTEIIQEQKVLTGGIPAEFVGTPGLLSNVITKSGTNAFKGSVNYFFQNDALVAENKNSPSEGFSTFDAACTIGGPIVRNKAWFFGSYRRIEREDDVTSLDTKQFLRTVENKQNQGYAKGTWAPTANDTISFTFLNDPTTISGRRDRNITNARDRSREQGGNNYSGQLLADPGRRPVRSGLQPARRRGVGLLGHPRAGQHRHLPRDRRPDAGRRAARRLRSGHHRPARHEGCARVGPVDVGTPRHQGRPRVVAQPRTSATRPRSTARSTGRSRPACPA